MYQAGVVRKDGRCVSMPCRLTVTTLSALVLQLPPGSQAVPLEVAEAWAANSQAWPSFFERTAVPWRHYSPPLQEQGTAGSPQILAGSAATSSSLLGNVLTTAATSDCGNAWCSLWLLLNVGGNFGLGFLLYKEYLRLSPQGRARRSWVPQPSPQQELKKYEALGLVQQTCFQKLPTDVFKNATEYISKERFANAANKERYVAFMRHGGALPPDAESFVTGHLAVWRRGFMAWWLCKDDFDRWCRTGEPPPQNSVPLSSIDGVRHGEYDGSLQVFFACAHEEQSFLLDFNTGVEDPYEAAQIWADNVVEVQAALGHPIHFPEASAAQGHGGWLDGDSD
eukprot:TRINITY_DN12770_c0_g5_i2.p1 TRINITY_DN12770_c0_g5~~TRINITY_DN12770_c0_g5_i2.p1  ORF type:complete len:338 (+),score=65.53 TRINITY_DN12770_c0_g5_i2:94-1107(+)